MDTFRLNKWYATVCWTSGLGKWMPRNHMDTSSLWTCSPGVAGPTCHPAKYPQLLPKKVFLSIWETPTFLEMYHPGQYCQPLQLIGSVRKRPHLYPILNRCCWLLLGKSPLIWGSHPLDPWCTHARKHILPIFLERQASLQMSTLAQLSDPPTSFKTLVTGPRTCERADLRMRGDYWALRRQYFAQVLGHTWTSLELVGWWMQTVRLRLSIWVVYIHVNNDRYAYPQNGQVPGWERAFWMAMRSKPIAGYARANQGFPKTSAEKSHFSNAQIMGYTVRGLTQMISLDLLIHGWDCVIRWHTIFWSMYARILYNQQRMMDNVPFRYVRITWATFFQS